MSFPSGVWGGAPAEIDFAENQLTKFSAGDAGDFNEAAGEWEMAPKCGSLPRDVGDLAGL